MNQKEKINELIDRYNKLYNKHKSFEEELIALRKEIKFLQREEIGIPVKSEEDIDEEFEVVPELKSKAAKTQSPITETKTTAPTPNQPARKIPKTPSDFEKFIGENLINKIGILFTIIGVGIGAKLAIDNGLVSPLTRIILGYLVGIGLLGFGFKLKEKYEDFSAVLVSGAMAIMYLITFFAYSFYGLIPSSIAFVLMLIFTAFTVFSAMQYNRQVIAHIGLVGAYAVPFLLSSDSGNVLVLFSYITIINIGILIVSLNRYWKSLYYSAFAFTWMIFSWWFIDDYTFKDDFWLAFGFATVFFLLFYATFLAYKIFQKEQFSFFDIVMLVLNSFIFYGIGYVLLDDYKTGQELLGLFTLGNALIHFVVSVIIYKQRQGEKSLLYLVSGLVLVFITIAIPVQLDGNWVTLLWAAEAALLFWIARSKNISTYEMLSYPLMILASISLAEDWGRNYNLSTYSLDLERIITPFFNIHFLSSMLFVVAFGFMTYWSLSTKPTFSNNSKRSIFKILTWMIPCVFLFALYYSFRIEIENYWNQLYGVSKLTINVDGEGTERTIYDYDLISFKNIWVIIYSLLFLIGLSLFNSYQLNSKNLSIVNLVLSIIAIIAFLGMGLPELTELQESYLTNDFAEYYHRGVFHFGIRYIPIILSIILMYLSFRNIRILNLGDKFTIALDYFLILAGLVIASSEFLLWLDVGGFANSEKLGLSIFWGICSLVLIALGIWKRQKHLRFAAMILFAMTLIKLFFYDIADLDTISKTIVFVSLGVLLLIISFLYNKYKDKIADEV